MIVVICVQNRLSPKTRQVNLRTVRPCIQPQVGSAFVTVWYWRLYCDRLACCWVDQPIKEPARPDGSTSMFLQRGQSHHMDTGLERKCSSSEGSLPQRKVKAVYLLFYSIRSSCFLYSPPCTDIDQIGICWYLSEHQIGPDETQLSKGQYRRTECWSIPIPEIKIAVVLTRVPVGMTDFDNYLMVASTADGGGGCDCSAIDDDTILVKLLVWNICLQTICFARSKWHRDFKHFRTHFAGFHHWLYLQLYLSLQCFYNFTCLSNVFTTLPVPPMFLPTMIQ